MSTWSQCHTSITTYIFRKSNESLPRPCSCISMWRCLRDWATRRRMRRKLMRACTIPPKSITLILWPNSSHRVPASSTSTRSSEWTCPNNCTGKWSLPNRTRSHSRGNHSKTARVAKGSSQGSSSAGPLGTWRKSKRRALKVRPGLLIPDSTGSWSTANEAPSKMSPNGRFDYLFLLNPRHLLASSESDWDGVYASGAD